MKWIFTIMLLVNLAIAGWYLGYSGQQQSGESSISSQQPDVGDLKIVSDIELKVRADYQRKLKEQVERYEKENAELKKNTLAAENLAKSIKKSDGCLRLGPFKERVQAQAVADDLLAYRIVSRVMEDNLVLNEGYWALIPSSGSVNEANELMKKLRKNGFEDIRRFTDGELANAISLGLFTREINAITQVRKADEMGLLAIVKPKINEKTSFWLEFELSRSSRFPVQDVTNSFPDVTIKACFGIASD